MGQAKNWSTQILVVALCLLTLAIRIVYSAIVPISNVHDEWDHIAANIAQGYGYVSSWPKTYIPPNLLNIPNYQFPLVPTASRVPVPVLYFAFMYKLFGLNDQALLIGQWLLDVLTCAILFLIAQKIFRDRRIAMITCVAWAFYFPALWMSNSRYSEPITTLLLASLIAVWLADSHPQRLRRYGLAGILWGLLILSRPIMITLPVILIPTFFMAARRRSRSILLACIVFAACGVLVIFPWIYRNYRVFHEFIPTSTLNGFDLLRDHYLIGQNDYLHYRNEEQQSQAAKEVLDRKFSSAAAVEILPNGQMIASRAYTEAALAAVEKYPGRYVVLSLVRVLRLWFNVGYGTTPSLLSIFILIGHLVLFGLIGYAIFTDPFFRTSNVMLIWLLIALHTVSYAAVAGDFRYSIPLAPDLLILASAAAVRLVWDNSLKQQNGSFNRIVRWLRRDRPDSVGLA